MADVAIVIVWTLASLVLLHVDARRRGDLDGYARRMRLSIPEHKRAELTVTMAGIERETRRYGLWAIVAGVLLGAGLVAAGLQGAIAGVCVMWAVVLGISLATRSRVTALEVAPGSTRVARLIDLQGDDFSTVWERAAVRLAPVVIVLAAVVPLVVRLTAPAAGSGDDILVAVTAVASLIALVTWFALGAAERRLVAAPEVARDEDDLAWLDALRGSAVRDLREAAGAVAVIASAPAFAVAGWMLLRTPPGTTDDPELTRRLLVFVLVAVAVLWLPLLVLSQVGRATANPAARLRTGQR